MTMGNKKGEKQEYEQMNEELTKNKRAEVGGGRKDSKERYI